MCIQYLRRRGYTLWYSFSVTLARSTRRTGSPAQPKQPAQRKACLGLQSGGVVAGEEDGTGQYLGEFFFFLFP